MSRADQSLTSTAPKTWRSAWSGSMRAAAGPPTKNPTSSSMSSARVGASRGGPSAPGSKPSGRTTARATRHDRARPTVVGDRKVPPVRHQRVAVRAQDAPDVRRMVDRRVEVDEVDDLDGHQHVDVVEREQQVGSLGSREELGDTVAQRPAATAGHQGVERRSGRQVEVEASGHEIDDVVADAGADTGLLVSWPEDAEGKVLDREVGTVGDRRPPVSHRRRPTASASGSSRVGRRAPRSGRRGSGAAGCRHP